MFAPTKTWRRWHRKINATQKRYAVASAIAASGVPSLVTARGHRIQHTPEIPLVVDNKVIDNIDKTKKAIALFESIRAMEDVERVKITTKLRAGKGKMRNRRHCQRRGPLVIYNERGPLTKAFRNLPGVELCNVSKLNLLQLAPGGHLGRFIIWTKDAFERLDDIFGTYKRLSTVKKGYQLPRSLLTSADLSRVLNSDEIQSALRAKKSFTRVHAKVNPLRNHAAMNKLNPHHTNIRRREYVRKERQEKARAAVLAAKRSGKKVEQTAAEKKLILKRKALKKKIAKSRKNFKKSIFLK